MRGGAKPCKHSHFLQPCDQYVNKKFVNKIRRVRDKFCLVSRGITDTREIQTKLIFGTAGLEAITSAYIRKSWDATGLWPMDYRFTEKYNRTKDKMLFKAASQNNQAYEDAGPAASLNSVRQRRSDRETFDNLPAIVDVTRRNGFTWVSTALQNVSVCLNNLQTVNNILMAKERSTMLTASTRVSGNLCQQTPKPKNVTLSADAPAVYLTHKDLLERRRVAELKEKAKEEGKAAAKAARAEKRRQRDENKKKKQKCERNIKEVASRSSVICRLRVCPRTKSGVSQVKSRTEMGAAMALAELETKLSRG